MKMEMKNLRIAITVAAGNLGSILTKGMIGSNI